MDITGALGGMNWAGMAGKVVLYLGYILFGGLITGVIGAIFYVLSFNVKADTWQLFGSGKDGQFAIGKKKKNRIKWVKKRTAWRAMMPLMNKKDIEPFDSEYVYPGNQVYSFILNNEWIPGRVNINKDEATIRGEINPVPYYVRNWQSLEHKKNAQEFAEHNFWEDNKYFFMVIATAALCLAMVGVTVYFTYKFSTGGTAAMSNLASAISNFNVIPGK